MWSEPYMRQNHGKKIYWLTYTACKCLGFLIQWEKFIYFLQGRIHKLWNHRPWSQKTAIIIIFHLCLWRGLFTPWPFHLKGTLKCLGTLVVQGDWRHAWLFSVMQHLLVMSCFHRDVLATLGSEEKLATQWAVAISTHPTVTRESLAWLAVVAHSNSRRKQQVHRVWDQGT